MLMRTDPFRDLDRFAEQVLGTAARPAVMPMDAWREGEEFIVEFDLPGIKDDSLDLDIERNVVTVRAERPGIDPGREMLATERPRGVFSGSWCSGTTSTPRKSTRLTPGACCVCGSRWLKGQSPEKSRSEVVTATPSSTPEKPVDTGKRWSIVTGSR